MSSLVVPPPARGRQAKSHRILTFCLHSTLSIGPYGASPSLPLSPAQKDFSSSLRLGYVAWRPVELERGRLPGQNWVEVHITEGTSGPIANRPTQACLCKM